MVIRTALIPLSCRACLEPVDQHPERKPRIGLPEQRKIRRLFRYRLRQVKIRHARNRLFLHAPRLHPRDQFRGGREFPARLRCRRLVRRTRRRSRRHFRRAYPRCLKNNQSAQREHRQRRRKTSHHKTVSRVVPFPSSSTISRPSAMVQTKIPPRPKYRPFPKRPPNQKFILEGICRN